MSQDIIEEEKIAAEGAAEQSVLQEEVVEETTPVEVPAETAVTEAPVAPIVE